MAYKVLGQVISTAPSTAATIVNLVKDPSFENLNVTSTVTAATTNQLVVIPGTNGYWQAQQAGSSFNYRSGKALGLTAANGNDSLITSVNTASVSGGTQNIYYGWNIGRTEANAFDQNAFDRNLAIQLKPGATYYYGAKYYAAATTGAGTFRVWYYAWDGNGTNLGSNYAQATGTAGSWQTLSASFTNSSNYRYATMKLAFDYTAGFPTSNYVAWDSVWFSESSTYNGSFPDADGTTNLTAPFNDRGVQYAGTYGASNSIRSYPGTLTDLYTVPAGSSAVVSTITVNNLATRYNIGNDYPGYTTGVPVRIAVLPSGQTLAKKHFIVFDALVSSNTTQTFTIGMTLAAGDKIQVSADTNDVSFTAFGSEN